MKKTRREFVIAASAAAGFSGGESPAADSPGWIDAHVHVWTPDTEKYPLAKGFSKEQMNPASFTPEELFAHSRPHGVSRIVLIQMSYYRFDNSYMLDVMEAHPGVFGGVAIIDETAGGIEETMGAFLEKGVRGFRVRATRKSAEAWPDSEGMRAMWTRAAETGQSICLLADPDSLAGTREMCRRFPETPVVIDHFARIGMTGTIEPKEVDQLLRLAEFGKVRIKTSAFYALGKKQAPYEDLGPMIRQLRDTYGADRLMWATDCPFQVGDGHTYGDSIALIRDRLDFLTEEDRDWMLRRTAEKVFF